MGVGSAVEHEDDGSGVEMLLTETRDDEDEVDDREICCVCIRGIL